jgi:hypothetical protein
VSGVVIHAALALTPPSFPEALGIWVSETFQAAWMLVYGVLFIIPLITVYGTMWALSNLAGRIRRGRGFHR